jgi:lipoyl-dependent peroxiredoxin
MSGVSRIGHAVWTGPVETGEGRLTAESGAYSDLPYTFASRTSSKAELTDPEELLATAHAGCFAMSLASTLTGAGQPAKRQAVSAEVTLGPTPAGRRITSSEITVDVEFDSPVEPGWFAEQVEAADKRCPFSALVRDSGGAVGVSIVNPV